MSSFRMQAGYDDCFAREYGRWRPVVGDVTDKFLACGILAHGLVRIRCDDCAHECLLTFSCKGRLAILPCMPPTDADRRADLNRQAQPPQAWMLVFIAWLIAAGSTLGALFFGEVMRLPPCSLCWYQRIFMFPLALILPFGLFPFDRGVVRAALPLAGFGVLVAAFHVLLVAGVIPERLEPCQQGVPCSETVIEWFGFVTIPLLSFAAFAAIAALLTFAHYRSEE